MSSTDAAAKPNNSNWNVPNALSGVRFILAMVVCFLIERGVFFAGMICFLIAASTDWIDGWWARKFNQVTKLGRILDPFVDLSRSRRCSCPLAFWCWSRRRRCRSCCCCSCPCRCILFLSLASFPLFQVPVRQSCSPSLHSLHSLLISLALRSH